MAVESVMSLQRVIFLLFRLLRYAYRKTSDLYSAIHTRMLFYIFGVRYGKGLEVHGIPFIDITTGCTTVIGDFFSMNSSFSANVIGRQQPCIIIQNQNSQLTIGRNVGMSSTAIVCHCKVDIGDNVKFGGNTVIYDTDFHSLQIEHRTQLREDRSSTNKQPVSIGNNVFIGAHSTILKGTTIGDNSIIGACSLVVGSIPPNQIWGGVPAKFIKSL